MTPGPSQQQTKQNKLMRHGFEGEQKAVREFQRDREAAKTRRSETHASVKALVSTMFPAPKARAKHKAAPKKVAAAKSAWVAKLKCAWRDMVESDAPDCAKVLVDNTAGAFRVSIHGKGPKSYSWTLRGGVQAAIKSLSFLWYHHTKETGIEPPVHLVLDTAEFEDE